MVLSFSSADGSELSAARRRCCVGGKMCQFASDVPEPARVARADLLAGRRPCRRFPWFDLAMPGRADPAQRGLRHVRAGHRLGAAPRSCASPPSAAAAARRRRSRWPPTRQVPLDRADRHHASSASSTAPISGATLRASRSASGSPRSGVPEPIRRQRRLRRGDRAAPIRQRRCRRARAQAARAARAVPIALVMARPMAWLATAAAPFVVGARHLLRTCSCGCSASDRGDHRITVGGAAHAVRRGHPHRCDRRAGAGDPLGRHAPDRPSCARVDDPAHRARLARRRRERGRGPRGDRRLAAFAAAGGPRLGRQDARRGQGARRARPDARGRAAPIWPSWYARPRSCPTGSTRSTRCACCSSRAPAWPWCTTNTATSKAWSPRPTCSPRSPAASPACRTKATRPMVVERADGSLLLSGATDRRCPGRPARASSFADDREFATAAGYVLSVLKHLPQEGESFTDAGLALRGRRHGRPQDRQAAWSAELNRFFMRLRRRREHPPRVASGPTDRRAFALAGCWSQPAPFQLVK